MSMVTGKGRKQNKMSYICSPDYAKKVSSSKNGKQRN